MFIKSMQPNILHQRRGTIKRLWRFRLFLANLNFLLVFDCKINSSNKNHKNMSWCFMKISSVKLLRTQLNLAYVSRMNDKIHLEIWLKLKIGKMWVRFNFQLTKSMPRDNKKDSFQGWKLLFRFPTDLNLKRIFLFLNRNRNLGKISFW